MTTTTERHLQAFCFSHRGVNYDEFRSQIDALDWSGWYPEVDHIGTLTGEVIPGDQPGYSVCDVRGGSAVIHDNASDAVIADS